MYDVFVLATRTRQVLDILLFRIVAVSFYVLWSNRNMQLFQESLFVSIGFRLSIGFIPFRTPEFDTVSETYVKLFIPSTIKKGRRDPKRLDIYQHTYTYAMCACACACMCTCFR